MEPSKLMQKTVTCIADQSHLQEVSSNLGNLGAEDEFADFRIMLPDVQYLSEGGCICIVVLKGWLQDDRNPHSQKNLAMRLLHVSVQNHMGVTVNARHASQRIGPWQCCWD
jgi:hypothetical protein